jgi:hypothetical protein
LLTPIYFSVLKHRLATGWTVRGSNPGEGHIFRTRTDRPWDPPSLLIQWVSGLFHGGRALTTRPHLGPRLKKEYSYTFIPPLCLHVLFWSNLYLYVLVEWRRCCAYRIHKTKRLFPRGTQTQALIFFILTQLHVPENSNHHRATKRNLKVK